MTASCGEMHIAIKAHIYWLLLSMGVLCAQEAVEQAPEAIICKGICLLGRNESLMAVEELTEQQGISFRNLKREKHEEK